MRRVVWPLLTSIVETFKCGELNIPVRRVVWPLITSIVETSKCGELNNQSIATAGSWKTGTFVSFAPLFDDSGQVRGT